MIGERLGPYRIDRELGSGGMGTVYLAEVIGRARSLSPGAQVAVKVVHPHLLSGGGFFKRFLREAEIGKAVRHPNVVRTYDVDALNREGLSAHFLVMEYVEGQTLRSLLGELDLVPEELCRHIGREVAKGLAAIHEAGAVHRDLKPENVLITPEHVVKIMDLGVAKLVDETVRLSRTGDFLGSVHYASPEQFRGGGVDVDGRADLHALGLILYELSSGTHPYVGGDAPNVLQRVLAGRPRRLSDLNPQVSAFFEEVVHTLLQKDREKRFRSAREILLVLERGERASWWQRRATAIRAETRRPLRRIRIPRETAVCGREEELSRLRRLYEKAAAGEGQVVLVEGEAGIGKTRLVDELIGRLKAEGEDLNFLYGSYPPGGAATEAGAWSTAYREHFGAEGLEEALAHYLTVAPALIPAFVALLRGEPSPRGVESLTKDSIHTVFVHVTRALARERPTVVLIEDQHFAPEEGRALLAAMALAVSERRILLIGTTRPGLPGQWLANLERLDHATRIRLPRLGPKDLARLLRDAFRSERLAQELGLQIAEKSDGNPFFAFEIIRGLRESRLISRRPDGSWVSTRKIREVKIPSSVLDLVHARIADIGDEDQELLEVSACCGFTFDPSLVAEVVGAEIIPALRRFAHLERKHQLVRAAGREFVFDHHQVQEMLYTGLSELLREQYHAALGKALEARVGGGEAPEEVLGSAAVDLAEHFLRGAHHQRALPFLGAALDHLEAGYMNDRAIGLMDRALEAGALLRGPRRTKVLIRKAGRLDFLGRREEQGAALEEALALAEADGGKALRMEARHSLGRFFLSLSRPESGREELLKALTLAYEIGDRTEEGLITGNLGLACWSLGRTEDALAHFDRHLALAGETGDRRGEARATGNKGLVYLDLGRYEEAREQCVRCIALAREIGERRIEGTATLNLGLVLWHLGRYPEAEEHDRAAIAIAREIGDRRNEELATGNLGLVYWSLGRNEEALAHHERHLAIAREIGDRRNEATANENIGLVLSNLGRREEARAHYERQLDITREIGHRMAEGRARGNLGGLLRALGYVEVALGHYEAHFAVAREVGDRRGEAVSLRNLGSCKLELGDPEAAEAHLRDALKLCREIGARDFEGHVLGGLGQAADSRGDRASAMERTREALALYREIGHQSGVASSLIALGGLGADAGEMEAAREFYAEAREIGEELNHPGWTVLSAAHEAALTGDAAHAIEVFARCESLLSHGGKLEARFLLFKATQDPVHLEEAHRLLRHLGENAPEEYRETLIDNVPRHRDVEAAWEAHGRT